MEIIRRTLKAYIISICLFLALTFLLAAIINFTGFRENWTFAGLITIMSIVSLITGAMEGNIIGKKGLFVGMAAAALLIVIILLAVGGVFAGVFGLESFSPFYIVPVIAGAIGGVLGANLNK